MRKTCRQFRTGDCDVMGRSAHQGPVFCLNDHGTKFIVKEGTGIFVDGFPTGGGGGGFRLAARAARAAGAQGVGVFWTGHFCDVSNDAEWMCVELKVSHYHGQWFVTGWGGVCGQRNVVGFGRAGFGKRGRSTRASKLIALVLKELKAGEVERGCRLVWGLHVGKVIPRCGS